jgi:hypothetical protein
MTVAERAVADLKRLLPGMPGPRRAAIERIIARLVPVCGTGDFQDVRLPIDPLPVPVTQAASAAASRPSGTAPRSRAAASARAPSATARAGRW